MKKQAPLYIIVGGSAQTLLSKASLIERTRRRVSSHEAAKDVKKSGVSRCKLSKETEGAPWGPHRMRQQRNSDGGLRGKQGTRCVCRSHGVTSFKGERVSDPEVGSRGGRTGVSGVSAPGNTPVVKTAHEPAKQRCHSRSPPSLPLGTIASQCTGDVLQVQVLGGVSVAGGNAVQSTYRRLVYLPLDDRVRDQFQSDLSLNLSQWRRSRRCIGDG